MYVRILSDGKIGDLVHCRAIAARLDASRVEERVVELSGWRALPLPGMPLPPQSEPARAGSPVGPDDQGRMPDLIIASGRRTIPFLKGLKRRHPETPVVFLKDPRSAGRPVADIIWAPTHDAVPEGGKFIATDTSPHGFDAGRLAEAKVRAQERFGEIDGPVTGVILGGDSGSVRWTARSAHAFARLLRDALTSERVGDAASDSAGKVLITTSRRTPRVLAGAVATALPGAWFDDGTENAYAQILALADRIVVTGDSHNMVSETLVTGAPVYVYRPPKLQAKLHQFLDRMTLRGAIRPLTAPLEPFEGKRVDATAEIADAIAERLAALRPD